MTRVFVYGSLLVGEPNHHVMRGATLVGPATTAPVYELFDLGRYPGLVAGGAGAVVGELFVVDAAGLERLDRFEGHPTWYRRDTIALASGDAVQAYLVERDATVGRPRIDGGDWRRYRRER